MLHQLIELNNKQNQISLKRLWVLQLVAWSILGIASYIEKIHVVDNIYHGPNIIMIIIYSILGYIFSSLMYFFYLWLHNKMQPLLLSAIVFISCLVFASIWTVSTNIIYALLFPKLWTDAHISLYFMGFVNSIFIFLCWSGIYYATSYHKKNQLNKQRMIELKSEAQEAKLRMFRYQLNPHFLFNTLNSISCLIKDKKNDSADKMLNRLAELLRFTLDSSPIDMVTVTEELELVDRYLQIEKVRFQEKLIVNLNVEEDSNNVLIPSLLIQPLIENSLKHAISTYPDGGVIDISIVIVAQRLIITISDDGKLTTPGNGSGLGLKNLQSRLQSIYEDNYSMESGFATEGGFKVNIEVPVHREEY